MKKFVADLALAPQLLVSPNNLVNHTQNSPRFQAKLRQMDSRKDL